MVLDIVGLSLSVPEFIWTIITFLVLMFLLKKVLFDPVFKVLDERKAELEEAMSAGREAEESLAVKERELSEELSVALVKARNEISAAREEASKLKVNQAEETDKKLYDEQLAIKEEVEEFEKSARKEADDNMSDFVAKLTEKLLGKGRDEV